MATRAESDLEVLAAAEPYESFTSRTITTAERLRRDLAAARRRGYAVDNEEHEHSVTCVAAAVFDHTGTASAAISVSGPTARLRAVGLSTLGELLDDRTRELSSELGYTLRDEAGGRGTRVPGAKTRHGSDTAHR